MKPKFPSAHAFPLAAAIAALLASSSVRAGQIWDGGGADNNWNTAANWDGDVLPTFTNAITFTGNTRNAPVNDLAAATIIGGINLTNDGTFGKTNAFTLSGNSITLGGNIITTTSSSAITDSSSLNMILNADRTITTNTNHNLTVSGVISQSGTRKLSKDGAGVLTLSNANTYSGGTTITAGTLNVANVSGLGTSGTLSINGASTTRLSTDTAFGGANPVYNMLMFGGGSYAGTIELNRATAGASTAITHNFGQLTISLNGGGAATFNVTAGANAPGALDTIAFTSMNAGNNNTVTETLNPTGGNITIGSLTAAGNSLVTMALSGTTAGNAITGVIGGTGNQQLVAISKIGASTWTLSNAGNNHTGGTTFSGGTLVFASGALGTTGAITGSGGTLRWAPGNTQDISSRLAMTAATSTFDTNGNDVTFASAIGSSVAASLTKTGSGTLTLQGTNTFTGITTVNTGTLALDYGASDTTKLSNTGALVLGGGTLNLAGATGNHVEVVSATTLTANTGSYVTRTGENTATLQLGAITNNSGTLDIGTSGIATTNNTHTAGTILGTWLTVGGADWGISADGGTNIPITAFTNYTDVARLGTPAAGIRIIADGSTTNVRLTEGGGDSGTVTLGAATTQINSLNQSISGGTGAVTVALPGQILRTNGILQGPTAGSLTIGAAGGTAALSGTLTPVASSGSVIVTNHSGNSLTINSVIADNGGNSRLVKAGTGVLVLNGLSTYFGGTTLQDGTLRVGATVGTMNTSGILGGTFNNGLVIANKPTAVFDVNGQTAYIKDLQGGGSLGGNVTLGSGTLQIRNPSNASNPYGGIISGSGNLIVGDTSAWVTTGAHTYTGTTTAFGGAFYVSILADGGIASGIGQSSSDASNLIIRSGTLSYNGTTAASTNRQFTLTGNGGFGVQNTGAITWSSTAAITHSGAGVRTLSFTSGNTGLGTFAPLIGNNGSDAVSVSKSGTNTWTLTNPGSTFTGTITLNTTTSSAGTLSYASAGGANSITFNQTIGTATLSYIGSTDKSMSGPITASALTTGTITLDSSGSGAVNYSNTGSLGSAASGNKNLILSGTNTGNNILAGGWNNNTGGAATLAKNGAGTWVLANANNFSGQTTVNGGTLRLANTGAVASSSQVSMENSTSLAFGTDTAFTTLPNLIVGSSKGATLVSDRATSGAALTHALGTTNFGAGTTVSFTAGSNVASGTAGISFTGVNLTGGVSGTTTLTPTTANVTIGTVTATAPSPKTLHLDGTSTGNTITGVIAESSPTVLNVSKSNGSTWTISGANTYTGTTAINGGTLIITGATQATSAITFSGGGKLGLDIGSSVTAASASVDFTGQQVLVTGTPSLASYTLLTANSITGTPTLAAPAPSGYALQVFGGNELRLVQTGSTYASWIAGFPGVGLLDGVNDDPDFDGIDNGLEMVLGGNPATGMDAALLPTIELVTNPVSVPAIPAGNYLLFTYRRSAVSEAALVAAACETDTDLVAPWTAAVDGVSGVVIQEDLNFSFTNPTAPADTDRVRVYVPRGVNTKLFGRLKTAVP